MLIEKCTCGKDSSYFTETTLYDNGIPLFVCNNCGVHHQAVDFTPQQLEDYYRAEYHGEYQRDIGVGPMKERYDHDTAVAEMRIDKYKKWMPADTTVTSLDIGASNGAFVDSMLRYGHDAWGIELGEGVNDNERILNGDFLKTSFDKKYDLITLHDVFEHLIDPVQALITIRDMITDTGVLVIDYPKYFCYEGLHHWRPIQHLWFHTPAQLTRVLKQEGFNVVEIDEPIPSKLVFYAKKSNPCFVYYGHHKCGSMWIADVLKQWFLSQELTVEFSDWSPTNRKVDVDCRIQKYPDLFIHGNSNAHTNIFLPHSRGLHVYRDPRDVIISGYFSHKDSHPLDGWPELAEHRKQLQKLSIKDGLMLEMEFSRPFLEDMDSWTLSEPNVMHVSLEELSAKPEEVFKTMFDSIGMDYNDTELSKHLLANSFDHIKAGTKKLSIEYHKNHFRSGKPNQWQQYFDDELKGEFKNRYNHILIKYGYECDDQW